MKCKNPNCNNEVKFDKQSNWNIRKVFCNNNSCCREFYANAKKVNKNE